MERLRWAEPAPTWTDWSEAKAEGAWDAWGAAAKRTPHVRAEHLWRVDAVVAKAEALVDPARELIAVGVSNGAVCATALAGKTRVDAVHVEIAKPKKTITLFFKKKKTKPEVRHKKKGDLTSLIWTALLRVFNDPRRLISDTNQEEGGRG